jgi:hypothetical protein
MKRRVDIHPHGRQYRRMETSSNALDAIVDALITVGLVLCVVLPVLYGFLWLVSG